MRLEALELAEGRQGRIGVVEVNDEAQVELPVLRMVGEAAAGGAVVERKAEVVIDPARLMPIGRNFPHFLDAKAIFLRLAREPVGSAEALGERAAGALGNQRVFGIDADAGRVARLGLAGTVEAEIAGDNAAHGSAGGPEHVDRRRHRKDVDTERLRLVAEPAHEVAQADDDAVGRLHLWRQQCVREGKVMPGGEVVIGVARHLGPHRGAALAPIGQQRIEAAWVHHGARQDMATDLGGFFDDGDREVRRLLLQPDGGGEPGWTRANDDDIGVDIFAFDHG